MSDMANYWAAKNWRVILATWSSLEVPDFYRLDERVQRVSLAAEDLSAGGKSRIFTNLKRVALLRRHLKQGRPRVVLSFMTESNLLAILAGLGLKLRVVVSERVHPAFHNGVPASWRILRRILYRWADDVVAQTEDAARWLEQICRVTVTVIPNALRVMAQPAREREELIVAVGRLAHQKGFDVLMDAFARLSPQFKSWRLVIIGEGAERHNLLRLRAQLSLEHRVQLIGQVPDVADWMSRAGLIVQPSRFEGFPNVVLEGMGLGAAVISTNCRSGPSEMIQEDVNGRLVPVDDPGALAQVMGELMASADERNRLGRAATSVRERYRQEAVMAGWEVCLLRPSGGAAECAE